MRLIDKDRCKADIEQFNRPLCDGYHMKDYVLNQIITDIENQPTVDAVPVRHGHWQITDAYPHNVHCSVCHKRFAQTQWAVWEDGSLPRNYCPHCGARMDAE